MRVYTTLCYAHTIYVHSTSPRMSKVCIHLDVYKHHVSNDTCRVLLDLAYQYVANEDMKTPTTKNSAIIITTSKQFLTYNFLKSPSNGKGHHIGDLSLEAVIDNLSILAYLGCYIFISSSKHFVCNEIDKMDNIVQLKDHLDFKYVHGNKFLG